MRRRKSIGSRWPSWRSSIGKAGLKRCDRGAGKAAEPSRSARALFENIDGIKFLLHEGGCGGTREDANNLCGLIAGYINHPNVAGATVLSLGCQNAQIAILRQEIEKRNPNLNKPVIILEQQQSGSESAMLSEADPADISGIGRGQQGHARSGGALAFVPGFEVWRVGRIFRDLGQSCHRTHRRSSGGPRGPGDSFGVSGVVRSGAGADQSQHAKGSFATGLLELMRDYQARARSVGSGFEMNPSPGNIRDGLLTDAMKSAGAAKKGGTSPVTAVLDYPEYSTEPGLNLQCTPGNDVECVTAQVGAGANVVLFTTGLGTPTGNPIAPVVKLSTNSSLAQRMNDIIDIDTGGVVSGETTIERMGEEILEYVIKVASGEARTKAELKGQKISFRGREASRSESASLLVHFVRERFS